MIRAVAIACALLLASCGDDVDPVGSGAPGGQGDAGVDDARDDAGDDSLDADDGFDDGFDDGDAEECELLTDDEVEEAIGPHDGGAQDYLFGGCVWLATAADGEHVPAIHVGIVPADVYESLAEIGDPVDGFGDGATYDELYGELWFPCRGDQFCGLKASIADSADREQAVLELGRLVQERA